LYGHPDLLRISATINGEDFVPFQEGIIIKRPGEGRSFAWHQDGATHWNSPDWNQDSHGINIMIQLYTSTPANGVWFVPGTHATGQVDIRKLVDRAGSERLPDAVPLVCGPGDVAISNRQILHGSFANTSPDLRVTVSIGFHPRRFVLGATGYVGETNEPITFDAGWIQRRSAIIGYAIDARRRYYPGEVPYVYQPHRQSGATLEWNEAARQAIRDYNKFDIRI
jgi:ectoine hydroxylase-related dioxygenase (phytanoyl-CoA dioxygenase family)